MKSEKRRLYHIAGLGGVGAFVAGAAQPVVASDIADALGMRTRDVFDHDGRAREIPIFLASCTAQAGWSTG